MNFKKIIQTKFLGPTNSRGSRVKATDSNGNSVTLNWSHEIDAVDNHRIAAQHLCRKIDEKNGQSGYELLVDGCGSFDSSYIFTASRYERSSIRQPGFDADGQPSEQS